MIGRNALASGSRPAASPALRISSCGKTDKPVVVWESAVGCERCDSSAASPSASSPPGVSYAYISRIEVGQRNPSVKALRKLAAALGVAPEWLETGIEPSRWSGFDKDELRLLARSLRAQIGNERAASLASEIECERRERARS
jgi:Helix-turn-helix